MAKAPVAKKAAAKPVAKAAPAAKTPVKAPTVTLRHLAAEIAETHGVTKKQTEAMLADLVTLTTKRLKKGEKVRLTGLGTMEVRKRPARMGRNPATGEAIKIKASKKVAFRVAKEVKDII